MNERSATISPGDVPTLRVVVDDGSIAVHCDASEWAHIEECADFATWLAPVVDIFAEHDAIARATAQPELTPARMAEELAGTARTLLVPSHLVRQAGRWRFHGGRVPADPAPPAREWGVS